MEKSDWSHTPWLDRREKSRGIGREYCQLSTTTTYQAWSIAVHPWRCCRALAARSMAPTLERPSGPVSRVCERCVAKKVKCNLARPSCSRCLEERTACVYSRVKRKPGPSKGSGRGSRSENTRERRRSQVARAADQDDEGNVTHSPRSASAIAPASLHSLHGGTTSEESIGNPPFHVMDLALQQQQNL